MSQKPLSKAKFEPSMTATVEMTEIDGIEQGLVLRYMEARKSGKKSTSKEFTACIGDLYVIINALRDYADILERVVPEWGLTGFHAASYELHADRCRKIAGKYAAAIGYNYDKALERCRKRQAKGVQSQDIGMDGLESLVRKQEMIPQKKGKQQGKKGVVPWEKMGSP